MSIMNQTRNFSTKFHKVTHCIFDLDGTLLDTERLYTEATQTILDPFGKTYTPGVKVKLMGQQHREVCKTIVDTYDLPITWEEYSALQRYHSTRLMINSELLPDTEHIYERIFGDIAKKYDKSFPHDVRMKMMGTAEKVSIQIQIDELKLPITLNEYLKIYKKLCRERMQDVPLLKGAGELVKHLHSHNIPICIATSSSEEMMNVKITNHSELFKLFHHHVCGSTDKEVKQSKPAPDIFLIAASRFPDNPKPENCLVFEDAPNGVTGAIAANMQCVMIPDEIVPIEQCQQATLVLNSLKEFKPEDFGLPPM